MATDIGGNNPHPIGQNPGGTHESYGTAIPTTGYWTRGSRRWNSEPSPGGPPGWVCTASGTPGTWKPMANLGA